MSDTPSDSMRSRRRHESRREPATIDLSATEVRTEPASEAEPSSEELRPAEASEAARVDVATSAASDETASSSDPGVRPMPDEVIPSDDARASAPDPDAYRMPESEAAVPPSQPRRGAFGPLLAASVIGGLVGAGAALLAEAWWRPRASGVDERFAQIEQRIAAQQSAPSPLEGRISRLEVESKALAERVGAAQSLAERSAKTAQDALDRPLPAPPPAAPPPAEGAASAAVLADLSARLGTIEQQLQERAQAATALQERVTTVQQRAEAAVNAGQALERRIADQDQRLAALAKQFSERGPDAMAASLRVTLADRLGDALEEGAPVGPVLSVLRRLDAKPEALRPFEPYAEAAPPTAAALAQEFRPLGQRMIAEARPPADDWGERMWRMLDKVVTVRAVGDTKSTDVASLVGRIEDALAAEALGEAAAAWDALPDSARQVAPEWGAKLKQRAAAEAAAQKMYAEAVSALEASMR